MGQLSNGLYNVNQYAEALSVQEALLSLHQRLGLHSENILALQGNLANTYQRLGRAEALNMYRDVYSGWLKLKGEEHRATLGAATNYANSLFKLERFEEARSLMRKTIPAAHRVLGDNDRLTLKMRRTYAMAVYNDPGATLDDLREAVTTLEDSQRIAARVWRRAPAHDGD